MPVSEFWKMAGKFTGSGYQTLRHQGATDGNTPSTCLMGAPQLNVVPFPTSSEWDTPSPSLLPAGESDIA